MKMRELFSVSNHMNQIQFERKRKEEQDNMSFEFFHPEYDFIIEAVLEGIMFVVNLEYNESLEEIKYLLEYLPEDRSKEMRSEGNEIINRIIETEGYKDQLITKFEKRRDEYFFATFVDIDRRRISFYSEVAGLVEGKYPKELFSFKFSDIRKKRNELISQYALINYFNEKVARAAIQHLVDQQFSEIPEYELIILKEKDGRVDLQTLEGVIMTNHDIDEETEVSLLRWLNYISADNIGASILSIDEDDEALTYTIVNKEEAEWM